MLFGYSVQGMDERMALKKATMLGERGMTSVMGEMTMSMDGWGSSKVGCMRG